MQVMRLSTQPPPGESPAPATETAPAPAPETVAAPPPAGLELGALGALLVSLGTLLLGVSWRMYRRMEL